MNLSAPCSAAEAPFSEKKTKNIERVRNSSCYISLCAKSVGNLILTVASHNTVTERQLFGFGNLWLYTFKKLSLFGKTLFNLSSNNNTAIYPQNIKNSNMISQLNQWRLWVGYPQTVYDFSCCWQQHKSCYSNISCVYLGKDKKDCVTISFFNKIYQTGRSKWELEIDATTVMFPTPSWIIDDLTNKELTRLLTKSLI